MSGLTNAERFLGKPHGRFKRTIAAKVWDAGTIVGSVFVSAASSRWGLRRKDAGDMPVIQPRSFVKKGSGSVPAASDAEEAVCQLPGNRQLDRKPIRPAPDSDRSVWHCWTRSPIESSSLRPLAGAETAIERRRCMPKPRVLTPLPISRHAGCVYFVSYCAPKEWPIAIPIRHWSVLIGCPIHRVPCSFVTARNSFAQEPSSFVRGQA